MFKSHSKCSFLVTASTTTLSNDTFATATLRATYQPSFTYFRSQKEYWNPQKNEWKFDYKMCDFVDDYRSSTVFDVIGSVGGLFALLQAIHVLLFGRPLFWGLTGQYPSYIEFQAITETIVYRGKAHLSVWDCWRIWLQELQAPTARAVSPPDFRE